MPRNTTGGKNFKKFKAGGEGYRVKASREASDSIVSLIVKKEKLQKCIDSGTTVPAQMQLDEEEKEDLKYMLVGRVIKRLGNGRNDVYCHDGVTRQCVIRGLLRKKGQVFIDLNSLVVVSLRSMLSSDDEEEVKCTVVKKMEDSDIIGLLADNHIAMLKTTKINKNIFADYKPGEDDDVFDRSDQVNEFINNNKEEELKADDL